MTAMQPIYVRASHVQAVFGFHRSTLYRWANEGRIQLYKRGGATFVKTSEVMDLIEGLGGHLGGQSAESQH